MSVTEIVEVETTTIPCDGGDGPLGHPRVFLHMKDDERQIDCPYCSRRFVLKEGVMPGGAH